MDKNDDSGLEELRLPLWIPSEMNDIPRKKIEEKPRERRVIILDIFSLEEDEDE